MPFSGIYYPAGFPLHLVTNSKDVLAAAGESWGANRQQFEREPIEIRVLVEPDGALSPQPTFRCQRYLYSVIGDADNFAVADLERLFGFISVSAQTAADHTWLRWFYLESFAYTLLAQRYIVPVHSACVARDGLGILLCGPSGAGKSTLSFACARAGWTFVSDDCTWLVPDEPDAEAIGKPHQVRFRTDSVKLFEELERYVERARPNGKISLEVTLSEFPQIVTAPRCRLRALAFLDRQHNVRPSFSRLTADEALDWLLVDKPAYTPECDAMHERTLRDLAAMPAYRLQYEMLADGCALLAGLMGGPLA
jgi:hypothetical protein